MKFSDLTDKKVQILYNADNRVTYAVVRFGNTFLHHHRYVVLLVISYQYGNDEVKIMKDDFESMPFYEKQLKRCKARIKNNKETQ